jgi:hypothetical protein
VKELNVEFIAHIARGDDQTPKPSEFDALTDAILDELLKLGIEADVTASLKGGDLSLTFGAEIEDGEDILTAFQRALGAVRTALHAAEVGTPGWEKGRMTQVEARLQSPGDKLVTA